jgi:CHAT domain-containing protein/uncharacterized protein HemY
MKKFLAYAVAALLTIVFFTNTWPQTSNSPPVIEKIFDTQSAEMIQFDLIPGEIHRYRVQLKADQYVHFRVNFARVDGVMTFYSPENDKLEEVSLPRGTEAMKELWWITRTSGDYGLEVRAIDPKSGGHYQFGIERLVDNTPQNQKVIAADRSEAEGWRLHEIGTEDALQGAIPKLRLAADTWRELGETWHYIESSMYLGEVYHNLSDFRKAIQVYESLLPLLDHTVDTDATWTYTNLASDYRALGENEKARDLAQRGLDVACEKNDFLKRTRGHPMDPRSFAIAYNSLGTISFHLGEKQKAFDYFYKSIPYWNTARQGKPEAFGLSRAYRGLSQVYTSVGDTEQATAYAGQALQYSRETADLIGQVEALNLLGVVAAADGDFSRASKSFKEGLSVAASSGDRNGQAKTLMNLGYLYLNSQKLDDAKDALTQAQRILHEIGNRSGEGRALSGLGELARIRGNNNQALELYRSALPMQRETRDREGKAETLYRMARVHLDVGDTVAARHEIEEALQEIEFVRRAISGAEMRAAYRATVQRYYELYIRLLMMLHEKEPGAGFDRLAFEQSELARARSMLESLREADADIREGVDPHLLEREHELQRLLQDKGEFQTRLLSGRSTREQAIDAEKEFASLLNDYREVQSQIRSSSPRYAALTQPEQMTLEKIQKGALNRDTVLLEYFLGEEKSFVWAITNNSIVSSELPRRSEIEALARAIYDSWSYPSSTRKRLDSSPALKYSPHQLRTATANLSRILLNPISQIIVGKRLLVVSDGALQYIPFSALTDNNNQLVAANHEVVNLPSAATLVALRNEIASRQSAPKQLAILADPVFAASDPRVQQRTAPPETELEERSRSLRDVEFGASLKDAGVIRNEIPRLPATRWEALEISKLVPADQQKIALDFQASRATALDGSLSQYRIIHIATHGLLNSRRPELSGIVLSLVDQSGQGQNGFLQVHEVYNLKLPADLVVLSACRTALGKDIRGEGMVGLTRGFMYAGAARVVSSLWEVDSKATAELMTRFYRKMLQDKLEPAAALHAAQVSISRDPRWRSPYYWAGFTIQGEYR